MTPRKGCRSAAAAVEKEGPAPRPFSPAEVEILNAAVEFGRAHRESEAAPMGPRFERACERLDAAANALLGLLRAQAAGEPAQARRTVMEARVARAYALAEEAEAHRRSAVDDANEVEDRLKEATAELSQVRWFRHQRKHRHYIGHIECPVCGSKVAGDEGSKGMIARKPTEGNSPAR